MHSQPLLSFPLPASLCLSVSLTLFLYLSFYFPVFLSLSTLFSLPSRKHAINQRSGGYFYESSQNVCKALAYDFQAGALSQPTKDCFDLNFPFCVFLHAFPQVSPEAKEKGRGKLCKTQ